MRQIYYKIFFISMVTWESCKGLAKVAAKGAVKAGAKLAINAVCSPLVCTVQLVDATISFANGDKIGGTISVVFAVADFFTYGATSLVFKDATKVAAAAAKDASIQATKDLARSGTNQIIKNAVTTTASGGQEILAQQAKVASKQFTKKLGKQLSKNIASGVISDTSKQFLIQGSKTTAKTTTVKVIGVAVRSTFFDTSKEGLVNAAKQMPGIIFGATKQAVTTTVRTQGLSETVREAVKVSVKPIAEETGKSILKMTSIGQIFQVIGQFFNIKKRKK